MRLENRPEVMGYMDVEVLRKGEVGDKTRGMGSGCEVLRQIVRLALNRPVGMGSPM